MVLTSGMDRLFLDPHALLARESVSEVQILHEAGGEGIQDRSQCLVQEYRVIEEAAVRLIVDQIDRERADDQRLGVAVVLEASVEGKCDGQPYP